MISFNDEEAQYIRQCLKAHDWWKSKKIVEKIDYETSKRAKQASCEHKFAVYKGEEYKCCFCGAHNEHGYLSWTLTRRKPKK